VVFIRPHYWIVRDFVQGSGNPEITVCWQFAPGRVEVENKTLSALFLDYRGASLQVLPLLGHLAARVEMHTGLLHPPRGWVSMNGADLPATTCLYSVNSPLPETLIWLLIPFSGRPDSGITVTRHDQDDSSVILEVSFRQGGTDWVLLSPPPRRRDGERIEDSPHRLIKLSKKVST